MTDSPRLGITQLEEDQALPEAVVNEGMRVLEAFGNCTHFKSRTTTAEPGSPADGDVYLVPTSATGTNWSGHDGEIAIFINTAWEFKDAKEGFIAWVDDDDELIVFDGSDWVAPTTAGSIEVMDEGASKTSALVSLDFVGAGVTASDDGSGNVEVNIPGGGAGGAPWALAGTGQTATGVYDFAVDGAKANIDFTGLSGASEILLLIRGATLAVSGVLALQLSVNNGSSFYSASGDYVNLASTGVETNSPVAGIAADTNATAARSGAFRVNAANVAGIPKSVESLAVTNTTNHVKYFVASTDDVDAVRINATNGGNITGGKIYCLVR